MGRVNETPMVVNWRMVEQPLHGPRTDPSEAILDFTGLLRNMNMDWSAHSIGEAFGGNRRKHLVANQTVTVSFLATPVQFG
jgi:hypothetical protein